MLGERVGGGVYGVMVVVVGGLGVWMGGGWVGGGGVRGVPTTPTQPTQSIRSSYASPSQFLVFQAE